MRRPLIVSIPGGVRCVLAFLGQVGARGRGDPGGSEKDMFNGYASVRTQPVGSSTEEDRRCLEDKTVRFVVHNIYGPTDASSL